ncbi:MAG: carbamoyltransferase HypF [Coriobacteriia bacterium]|nr:carbamoyltransferase HypF [Coriobacteriia bacterium]
MTRREIAGGGAGGDHGRDRVGGGAPGDPTPGRVGALRLHITGIVQGIGFRPFVYNLAVEAGLTGWVLNASDGVHCHVEGPFEAARDFPQLLESRAPVMSVIEHISAEEVAPQGCSCFEIRKSVHDADAVTLVSPDIATCPECSAELWDSGGRRWHYPFINCTNCGPRFTIIEDVPYDRPMTTMRGFEMCAECAAEYRDPGNRRFHAQPNACFTCGPRLYLNAAPHDATAPSITPCGPNAAPRDNTPCDTADWGWSHEAEAEAATQPHRDREAERERSDAILSDAAARLAQGQVLAIKGLGGFHLACAATSEGAVAQLRSRKHRWGKPLAIMVQDVSAAHAYCDVSAAEESLLAGTTRPIVLLMRSSDGFAPAPGAPAPLAETVGGGLAEIGIMLPYTPLHHLLLSLVQQPLVMTSGNISDEPICIDNAEALKRLSKIADAFLMHDRKIYSRYDDSVVRVVGGTAEPVRRARGYAPYPLPVPLPAPAPLPAPRGKSVAGSAEDSTETGFESDTASSTEGEAASITPILGVGPEQKNTFTLLTGEHAFVSQHIGDLENAETMAAFEETLAVYERLFRVKPTLVAHDLHPEYLSSKWALGSGLPTLGVQHHHAHIASVTAEHNVSERVVGIAFDGTGYGIDGHIWGGEVLLADWSSFERFAHLRYVPMPGGASAIRRPARMAIGTLIGLGLLSHPGAGSLRDRLASGEERTLRTMVERSVNSPLTSSVGRLFDTVAALTGIADDAAFEGQAAMLLEAAASRTAISEIANSVADGATADGIPDGAYRFGLLGSTIDPTPVIAAVLDDVASGADASVISARFHHAVVKCVVDVALKASLAAETKLVALGGGVFMNRIILGGSAAALKKAGLTPLTHVNLPANDGAISYGQAIIAQALGTRYDCTHEQPDP